MKFSELQRLQRREGITVLSADERIEQLEARLRTVTKERDALRAAVRHEADCVDAAKAEIDALQAKIEQMGRQEPVGTLHDDGCFVWRETAPHQSNYVGWKMALYALPGAQSAPNVPEGFALVNADRFLAVLDREDWRTAKNRAELRAMLAAAPEAKP